jgi:hypothetical protein
LDLLAYWAISPPVHVLVRAYMGGGGNGSGGGKAETDTMTEDDALAILEAGIVRF